jgi:hypothetical protein
MITLRDGETGQPIGTISDEQLRFLQDQLEEESPTDQDYWIDAPTLDALRAAGADEALVALLESALAGREGVEVKWERS